MSNINVLTRALPVVARALADNLGVQLVIAGESALTDGEVIVIPALNPDDSDGAELAYGYIAHEAGHVKHTTSELSTNSPLEKTLLNVIEDIRVESLVMGEFPGSRRDLDVVTKRLDRGVSIGAMHPASQLAAGIQLIGRARVLGQSITEEADAAYDVLKSTLSAGKLAKLMAYIGSITRCRSTEEALSLARRVLVMLEEPEQEPEEAPAEDSNRSDDEEPQPGPESDDGGTDSQGCGSDDSAAAGAESAPTQSKDQEGGQSDLDGQPVAESGGRSEVEQAFVAAALNATADDLGDVVDHSEVLRAQLEARADSSENPAMALYGRASMGNPQIAEEVEKLALDGMNGLRAVLNGLVQSTHRAQPTNRRVGNRIDSSRLSRVLVGDNRVFRKQVERQGVNTALDIVVDLSHSMKPCEREALGVAFGLGKVLQTIKGVNPAISSFPAYENGRLAVRPLLKHGERVDAVRQRFGLSAAGGTPLGECLWSVAATLAIQPEPRKVMVVVTDGDPDNLKSAEAIINRCERAGIEMMAIAIGFGAPSIQRLFKNHRVIGSISELRTAIHEMVLATLTQAA